VLSSFFVINERRLKRMSSAGFFVMNLRSLICCIGAVSSTFFTAKAQRAQSYPRGARRKEGNSQFAMTNS
jgi:hypothetical protein